MHLKINSGNLRNMFLASLSGVLLTLSFPKAGFSYLAWIAFIPFFHSINRSYANKPVWTGLCFGISHFLTLLYWVIYTLNVYGYIPIVLCIPILMILVVYLSLYPILFGWLLCRSSLKPSTMIIAIPALWVCLEFIRAFVLTGFPWELTGHSQHNMTSLIQIADITGVYGISFLIVLVNTALYAVVLGLAKKEWLGRRITVLTAANHVLIAAAALLAVFLYGHFRIQHIDRLIQRSPSSNIAVIQGNIDQSLKWDTRFQYETLNKYSVLTQSAKQLDPELVVWPETAAPFYYDYDKALTVSLKNSLSTTNCHFLIGFPSFEHELDNFRFYNSAYLMDSSGSILGTYSKVHLVPFGEYVPLQNFLPFIHKLTEQSGDFFPGKTGEVLNFNQMRIGTQICFEAIFPDLSREMVKNGANLIVNITNDAWFGKSSAPYQHFSMIKFRAVENKRSLARAANTGISGFIDPCGRELSKSQLFQDSFLVQKIAQCDVMTFYTRHGDVFVIICFLISLTVFSLGFLSMRK